MSQKGTFGLLLVGGGVVIVYLTWTDLVASQAAAAAAATAGGGGGGTSGQSPFTGVSVSLATPPFSNPAVQHTSCPPGQVSVLKGGASTQRVCVPAGQQFHIGQRNSCPPGQVWIPVGGGTTGKCYAPGTAINVGRQSGTPYQPPYVSKGYSPKPCYFGFIFC